MNEGQVGRYATAVFAVTAIGAAAIPNGFEASFAGVSVRAIAVVVALAMFFVGAVLMAVALVIGAGRSRTVTIEIGGLFFSQAPKSLRYLFFAQIAIGFATAWVRPSASFGILAPIFGLGLCALWGARHGTFPARET